jgi:hypothetical protein
VLLVFIFTYFGIGRWAYSKIKHKHGISRANYLLPVAIFVIFTSVFDKVLRDENGMHGGLDDNKFIVRHRKPFWLLLLAVVCYVFLLALRIRRRSCQVNMPSTSTGSSKSVISTIMSLLSTPITFCSGGACNSIYMSTLTSLFSSFSLPMTVLLPFLTIVSLLLQSVGLVSLFSVKRFSYLPFWVYLVSMCLQLVLESWICGIGMVGAVIWNAKYHKHVFGRKSHSSV